MIRGIIFDLDGTITKPYIDFRRLQKELGTKGPILEFIESLEGKDKKKAYEILDTFELDAAKNSELNENVKEVLQNLHKRKFFTAILTRNKRDSVDYIMDKHQIYFDTVFTRDDAPPKPAPDAIFMICRRWKIEPKNVIVAGDYIYDIEAGRKAGCKTILLRNLKHPISVKVDADYEIFDFKEILKIVDSLKVL